ncbi:MAG: UDP-N-acetylmuramoyl-tripeptide--D-alanyl-D-alanine ligase [Thiomicrorhabdus sp.]|nr:MAG: UDP-N-acetylmuramoyl-tripeptide--D-alanyl-D-alanine ligase [Thiomicrorhabdus sp.]
MDLNDQLKNGSPERLVEKMQSQVGHSQQGQIAMNDQHHFSWTLEALLNSVDGEWIGAIDSENSVQFTSISTDTRTLESGALYIAIKGENFDGHAFIAQAIQQGAVAVLVSDDIESIVPGVLVEDTRIALGQFAKWHRLQMPVKKLIAVTGSNGKTTNKTLLLNIFSAVGKTLATEGNLNNDFGVPRTLLNLRPDHEYAIIEMGANHPREIGYLTNLALPDIALITNASGAHLEGFGSLQGVIDTKGEIFQGLNQREGDALGVAIINTDSNGYQDWLSMIADFGIQNLSSFGSSEEADVLVTHFRSIESGIKFDLTFDGQCHSVSMPVLGQHNAQNAAACVAVALNAGLNWQQIKAGLLSFTGVAGRLQKQAIKSGCLIDDSYNANPESVKAGINALVALPGKSILCLGAMAELGEQSEIMHQEVAQYAKQNGVDYLLVYGEAAQTMPDIFGKQGFGFDSHQYLSELVLDILQKNSQQNLSVNVLVKGSRSAEMERITQAILSVEKLNNR